METGEILFQTKQKQDSSDTFVNGECLDDSIQLVITAL